MFNDAHISLNGYVATQPQIGETRTGIPSLTMRVAWTPRLIDRVTGEWKDAGTSFLSVRLYRKLAENAATCLRKGDPVIVRGRFIVRDYEDKSGAKRTAVEVDAISVGHDLNRGVAQFQPRPAADRADRGAVPGERVRPRRRRHGRLRPHHGPVGAGRAGRRRRGRGERPRRRGRRRRRADGRRAAGTAGRSTRRPWTR